MCDGNLAALREYEHKQYMQELKAKKCDYCGQPIWEDKAWRLYENNAVVCQDCFESFIVNEIAEVVYLNE